eukprot:388087-Hanusia_phi.AAC.1
MASYGSVLREWDFAAYTVRRLQEPEVAGERQCVGFRTRRLCTRSLRLAESSESPHFRQHAFVQAPIPRDLSRPQSPGCPGCATLYPCREMRGGVRGPIAYLRDPVS